MVRRTLASLCATPTTSVLPDDARPGDTGLADTDKGLADARPAAPGSNHARAARGPLAALLAPLLAATLLLLSAPPQAAAVVVRAANGHLYGVLYRATVEASHRKRSRNARGETSKPLEYQTEHGPIMLKTKVYPIFWAPSGHQFPAGYEATIEQYLEDIAESSKLGLVATNDWSIPTQYTNAAGEHISEIFEFGEALHDETAYPGSPEANCPGDTKTSRPCIADAQVQAEVKEDVIAHGWPMNAPGTPEDQYLVFFPPGVEGCSEPEGKGCTYSESGGYCGYHGSFEAETGMWLVYSNIPSIYGCASGQAPDGVSAPATKAERQEVDGTLDTLNHELAESATDPLVENKRAWSNPEGQEVGDLCTEPIVKVTDPESGYGLPLGGFIEDDTAFNELIDGKQYYVQALWSNAPTKTPAIAGSPPAGCVQRLGPTPQFKAPEHLQAQLAATFNAEGSYDIEDPITTYEWSFGDGTAPVTTTKPTVSHLFKSAGSFQVSLKVSDARGSTYASTQNGEVTVEAAKAGEPSARFTAPESVTEGETVEVNAAESTDPTNTIDRYEWSFGDGTAPVVQEGESPSALATHTYATAGHYTVKLTVTDMSDKSASAERQITVNAKSSGTTTTTSSSGSTTTTSGSESTTTTTSSGASTTTSSSSTATASASAGAGAGAPTSSQSTTTSSVTTAQRKSPAQLRLASATLVRGRLALVHVACRSASGCHGRLVLLVPRRLLAHGKRAKRGLMRIALVRYSVKPGERGGARILLPPKLARLIRAGRPLLLTVRVLEGGAKARTIKIKVRAAGRRRAIRRRPARKRR
jgi:PKD repeat protein